MKTNIPLLMNRLTEENINNNAQALKIIIYVLPYFQEYLQILWGVLSHKGNP